MPRLPPFNEPISDIAPHPLHVRLDGRAVRGRALRAVGR